MSRQPDITQLLRQWQQGREAALDDLVPLVYQELRALARSYLRKERRGHTLQATDLVHELFLRLVKAGGATLQDRAHFFGVAARAMRQILVAHARRHGAAKRGGGQEVVGLDGVPEPAVRSEMDLTALDAALASLADIDPLQAKIVELRVFGGYTIEETAELAGCSHATVSREWKLARIWLYREMRDARP